MSTPEQWHKFEGPEHVCGLSGFGYGLDDRCPACEEKHCRACGKTYSDGKHTNDPYVLLQAEAASLRSQLAACQREREEVRDCFKHESAMYSAAQQQLQQMKEALKPISIKLHELQTATEAPSHKDITELDAAARALLSGKE